MQRDARQTPPWMWVSLGISSGLLITVAVGLGLRYLRCRHGGDPRARQVEELLEATARQVAGEPIPPPPVG